MLHYPIAQKAIAVSAKEPPSLAGQGFGTPTAIASSPVEEDDFGYIDYLEIYEARQAEMTSALTQINEATVRIGEQLGQRSSEMQDAKMSDTRAARRFIKRAADDMTSYSHVMSTQVSALSGAREPAFTALSSALALQADFPNAPETLSELRSNLLSLVDGAATAQAGMIGMRNSADGLPRMSKELNKAKRSVVQQLDLFLSEIEGTRSTVLNIISSIERVLPPQGKPAPN